MPTARGRLAGRISDWNDAKGYGFVVPNGGGERAFVHVNEFQRGSRRPADGDLISYLPIRDPRGRMQASQVRHAGQGATVPRRGSRLPRAALGASVLLIVIMAAMLGRLPKWLAGGSVALSALSWLMYWRDKSAAEKGTWRTPESTLHLVDLAGGWPGALIAQQMFRHKTVKPSFQLMFWLSVALNLVAMWLLVSSGRELMRFMP